MSKEAVSKIKECESLARDRRAAAELEAKQIIKSAHENGQKSVEDTAVRAEADAKKKSAVCDESISARSAEIEAEITKKREALYTSGLANKEKAVGYIVKKLTENHN